MRTQAALSTDNDERYLHQFLTFRLSRIQAKLNAQASHILKQTNGLSLVQWRVLSLVANGEPATASALTQDYGMDKGLFSRTLKALAAMGLVSLTVDPEDHRSQLIVLTGKGRSVHTDTLPVMRARQAHLTGGMNEQEKALLFTALDQIESAAARRDFS